MLKTEKLVRIKRSTKAAFNVVREHYLREDITCKSKLCNQCERVQDLILLPDDTTHYIIPSCEITQKYAEILQLKEITGLIFLQTILNFVQQSCGRRLHKELNNLVKDPLKGSVVFNNEFHNRCYIPRKYGKPLDEWRTSNIYNAALWLHQHFETRMPIVIITDDLQVIKNYGSKTCGIFVLSMDSYITGFWPNLVEARDLLESINTSSTMELNIGTAICKGFQDYYPTQVLQAGIKSGRFYSSYLKVNKHNPTQEAFVQVSNNKSSSETSYLDILIPGVSYRNRSIDGDLIVVELLPKEMWLPRSSAILEHNEETSTMERESVVMMTGRVVGILQRNLRDYVVSLPENLGASSKNHSEKVLAVPWDPRIPKIRISTRQAERLRNDRFVVRVDSWEINSLYPNGHFVKSLGTIGDIETEISTILVEHGLSVVPFTDGILKEMPTNTVEQPWEMDPEEIRKRKDIRKSHLVFSIDPIGCEDVDDTLSIRELKNGEKELGVHIADVTYFVKTNTLTDLEARSKSTTVYLADRRYDMLPEVLSAQLCSLISGVDRYAVSVIWRIDENCKVLDVWYGRTVIRSSYKLFYEAAQKIADHDMTVEEARDIIPELQCSKVEELQSKFEELQTSIKMLMSVARQLKEKRSRNGAIELESTEVQIRVGNEKEVQDVLPKQTLEIHETIAECMIFANHWVAKQIKTVYINNALLRNHPPPKQDFFTSLKVCSKAKGYHVDSSTNEKLANSLNNCKDADPNVNKIMRMLATQAMMVASYFSTGAVDPKQYTHYGLALDAYTHFTSPIRRYADVIVHRLLLSSVSAVSTASSKLLSNKELQELCEHMNVKHREADHAQKESLKLFQAMYFKQNDTNETCICDGVVFKMRSNGVLVFIPKYGIKGAVILKRKDGLVACPTLDGKIKYSHGNITQTESRIIVVPANGKSIEISLFSYLKVHIIVKTSRTHADMLYVELESYETDMMFDDARKVERREIIQEVKEKEIEVKEIENYSEIKDVSQRNLRLKYGQTHESVSLYRMFQRFKKAAIEEKVKSAPVGK